MEFSGVLFLIAAVVVFIVLFFLQKSQIEESQEKFLRLVNQQFESEQNKAVTELETRKQAVEISVSGLKEQLNKYEKMVKDLETDRAQKYGNLENELKNASQTTTKLQETTNRLNDILGNVKLRGQWGERMAEDIIVNAGLLEGVNYKKQKKLAASDTKPDYTFLLPDKHIVNMDVKFPLDNYLKMVNAATEGERDSFEKEFIKNVKDRIKELRNRDYINPSESTLDFVLLFIPNEQVFGIIQEKIPGLIDEALKEKVVLCSPFTLYAMLSVIRQAYENFRFEKDLKEIIKHIKLFSQHYAKFKTRFEDVGKAVEVLEKKYSDVKNVDFKKLDSKMRHIENYKKGKNLSLVQDEADMVDINSGD